MRLLCPAKVNLYLAILGRGASGYHDIDTIFVKVPTLADTLEIEPAEELRIKFVHTYRYLAPAGGGVGTENNTVSQVIRMLEQKVGRPLLYRIKVIKNIPPESGLGGGSSDAAAVLRYLNEVENLGFTRLKLMELGAEIGMDVPFFLSGHAVARGTHFGEIITPLPPLPSDMHVDIGFTGIAVSTKKAFAEWDAWIASEGSKERTPSIEPLLVALTEQNSSEILKNIHNDFEQIFPNLSFKRTDGNGSNGESSGSVATVLSGSGGAYASLFRSLQD